MPYQLARSAFPTARIWESTSRSALARRAPFASEALERKRTELYRVASSAEDQMNRQAQTATEAVLQDLDGSAAQVGVLAATIESGGVRHPSPCRAGLDARLTTGMPEDAVQVSWPRNYGGMAVDQPGRSCRRLTPLLSAHVPAAASVGDYWAIPRPRAHAPIYSSGHSGFTLCLK